MARPLRIHEAGGWYHVMARGDGGEAILRSGPDRRRFLGLVSELPGRSGLEVHAFVVMDNHYHLLVRCGEEPLGEGMRWLHTTFSVRYNLAHRRHGHVLQGRYKAMLIRESGAVERVARYVHLNPVRVRRLGLSGNDRQAARTIGSGEPGAGVVERRLAVLREYEWSSWRVYAGLETAPGWLETGRLLGKGTGRAGRSALVRYTEEPLRLGVLESPWKGLVGGVVLGDVEEAEALIRRDGGKEGATLASRLGAGRRRPTWGQVTATASRLSGSGWEEMAARHGDWRRDAVVAVASSLPGWRLVDVAREMGGVSYAALAQAAGRFRRRAATDPARREFASRLRAKISNVND